MTILAFKSCYMKLSLSLPCQVRTFLRRLQILVNGPLSRNFRLHSGWLKVKSNETMQYLTNDLQNYVVAFKKEKWPKTVEQLQASWPHRVSLSEWSGEEADISNWGRHCDQFRKTNIKKQVCKTNLNLSILFFCRTKLLGSVCVGAAKWGH